MDLYEGERATRDKLRQKQQESWEKLCASLAMVCGTPEGIELVRWILAQSGALVCGYKQEMGALQFEEGKRYVGIQLLSLAQEADVNLGLLLGKELKNGR